MLQRWVDKKESDIVDVFFVAHTANLALHGPLRQGKIK